MISNKQHNRSSVKELKQTTGPGGSCFVERPRYGGISLCITVTSTGLFKQQTE